MNNSLLVGYSEAVPDKGEVLRRRESELVKIIEAIKGIETRDEWSTLKTYVFDGVLDSLEHRMASESHKMPLDEKEIYKLQGQIAWAKKFSNLETLAQAFRLELTNVRSQLNPPTERDMAPDTDI